MLKNKIFKSYTCNLEKIVPSICYFLHVTRWALFQIIKNSSIHPFPMMNSVYFLWWNKSRFVSKLGYLINKEIGTKYGHLLAHLWFPNCKIHVKCPRADGHIWLFRSFPCLNCCVFHFYTI